MSVKIYLSLNHTRLNSNDTHLHDTANVSASDLESDNYSDYNGMHSPG